MAVHLCSLNEQAFVRRTWIGIVTRVSLRQAFSDYRVRYLVLLGAIAMVAALWLPRGLWSVVASRSAVRLFPVGYVVTKRRRVV